MKSQQLESEESQINQTRAFLNDPSHPQEHLLANIIIYVSQYYPHTHQLLHLVLSKLTPLHLPLIVSTLTHLQEQLLKELIYGPSSSYLPPADIPANYHHDIHFQPHSTPAQTLLIQSFQKNLIALGIDTIIPPSNAIQLAWYNSRLLSMASFQKNHPNLQSILQIMEIDGQNILEATPLLSLLCVLQESYQVVLKEVVLKEVSEQADLKLQVQLRLNRCRLSFLHNKILKNPVKKLSKITLDEYKKVICLLGQAKSVETKVYIPILVEFGYALLFYYKYNQAEQILEYCSQIMKIEMEFTGKLGRRTKYQSFDTAQLVLNLKTHAVKPQQKEESHEKEEEDEETERIHFIDGHLLIQQELQAGENNSTNLDRQAYDEESILLEKPTLIEQNSQSTQNLKQISHLQALVVLAAINYSWKTTPHDEILYQNISASISTLIQSNNSYPFQIDYSILLLRSLNQFPRIKHAERALTQLEKLKNYYNQRTDKHLVKEYLHCTPYHTCLSFIVLMAEKYIELGLSISAIELYQAAGLYEECIDGLIQKNYKEKAEELIEKVIKTKAKTPRLLCMLGDIHSSEASYYEQAWVLSKKTYARAQRSLGWIYFGKQNYSKAIESFEMATQACYYHPNTWFTLGCCYMKMNDFKKSLKAFSECISIDDTQGEAWGNMASCYIHLKKTKEAYSTLEQAVKYSESNWKLWANFLTISLTLKQFYKFFECIEKLVKLDHEQSLNEEVFKKIVLIMKFKNESNERRRILFNYKNRIERLFNFLGEKIGGNPSVWRGRTNFQIQMLEYLNIMKIHYSQLHKHNQINPNDLVDGYETAESTQQTTHSQLHSTKQQIIEFKQKQLNMTMKIGWEENKIACTQVKNILVEFLAIYNQYSDKSDLAEIKVFVVGLKQKIEACLESEVKEIQLELI